MKTKLLGIIAIIAIIALSMTGCKQEDDLCKCPNGTEHLFGQPCCEGTDCKCVVYYGPLPNGVKIYKGEGVTDAQMAIAVQNAIDGYNAAVNGGLNPDGKISKLVITTGGAVSSWDAVNMVLSVDAEAPQGFFWGKFQGIALGTLTS